MNRTWLKVALVAAGIVIVALAVAVVALVRNPDPPAAAVAPVNSTPASLGSCDQLAGTPTMDVVNIGLCDDGNTNQILMSAFYDCPDGRELHWNDFGWGWSDGDWREHERADGQLVPPDSAFADCPQ